MSALRIAAAGLGRLGRYHAESVAWRLPECRLTAVCSPNTEELEDAAQVFPESSLHEDFTTMLEKTDLDAVILSTPSDLHCLQIAQALEHGLHIFCEKPLGTDPKACDQAIRAHANHSSQVVMLGFMRRYDASYQDAKKRIDRGDIGRPILFRSYSVDPESTIKGALAYAPHSAGQFLDMAVHDIDLARWMLDSEPRNVFGMGGCYAHPEFAEYDDGDNVGALMQFENEAIVFLFAGRTAAHGYQVETEIIGTKRSLRIGATPQANLVEVLDQSGVRRECSQHFLERFGPAYVNELSEFMDCIRNGRQPEVQLNDGLRATEIAIAATQSFRSGCMIRL